jgi:hypothetical protein
MVLRSKTVTVPRARMGIIIVVSMEAKTRLQGFGGGVEQFIL